MIKRTWQIMNHPIALMLIWGSMVIGSIRGHDIGWAVFAAWALGVNTQRAIRIGES